MKRARAFYEAVFRVQLTKLESGDLDMWAFPMQQGGTGICGALVHIPHVPSGGNSVLVYFMCEDCAVEAARVAENGGRIDKPKFSIGQYGFISLVYDCEGNMIGLHSAR
jgi:predicted enzyme related to lactoylglutathione lyase